MGKAAIVISLVVLGVSLANAQALENVQDKKKDIPDKIIYLKARQFSFSPDTIKVRQGDRVRIIAKSQDVTHGFAISAFNVNAVIEPGKETIIEFVANKKGEYDFVCSVYCGSGHSRMKGTLIVE